MCFVFCFCFLVCFVWLFVCLFACLFVCLLMFCFSFLFCLSLCFVVVVLLLFVCLLLFCFFVVVLLLLAVLFCFVVLLLLLLAVLFSGGVGGWIFFQRKFMIYTDERPARCLICFHFLLLLRHQREKKAGDGVLGLRAVPACLLGVRLGRLGGREDWGVGFCLCIM